jgi:ABC-type multidrug transport system fused ATPase/permease subunit
MSRQSVLLYEQHPSKPADGFPSGSPIDLERALAEALFWKPQSHAQGLDTVIGENAFSIERRTATTAGIGAGFLKNSPLLILDEPSSTLTRAGKRHLMFSAATSADRTVLIIAHRKTQPARLIVS